VSPQDLEQWNSLESPVIHPGRVLRVAPD